MLFPIASNHLRDTLQTHSRQLPDTIQTLFRPSKHLLGTFYYISIPLKDAVPKSQVTRRVVVVVVYRYIIMPLRGPTCKIVLARIQFRLNSKLDLCVAILQKCFRKDLICFYRALGRSMRFCNPEFYISD